MAKIHDEQFVEEIRAVKKTAFGTAYLILKNTSDCEDAMSAAIVKAYEHRNSLKKRNSFRAWFLHILRNECYNIQRERQRIVITDDLPEQKSEPHDMAQALDLHAALMKLPEKSRNALYLQEQGYTMDEIAEILDVPSGTIKSRIFRAKAHLHTMLEDV